MGIIIAYLIVSFGVGIVACFYGNKIYYPMIAVYAFTGTFFVIKNMMGASVTGLIVSLVIALIVGIMSRVFYKAGVFMMASGVAGSLSFIITMLFVPVPFLMKAIIALLFAIIVGIIALKWNDFFILVSTAFSGATCISSAICFMIFNIGNLGSITGSGVDEIVASVEASVTPVSPAQAITASVLCMVLFICGVVHQSRAKKKAENQ